MVIIQLCAINVYILIKSFYEYFNEVLPILWIIMFNHGPVICLKESTQAAGAISESAQLSINFRLHGV